MQLLMYAASLRRIFAFSNDISTEDQLEIDLELVERLKQGDPDAVDELVELYTDSLYRFVYNQVGGTAQDAEDVVQETFVAALKAVRRFRGKSKLRTWLFGIASHKVADHQRRSFRQDRIVTSQDLGPWFSAPPRPDEMVEKLELRQTVREALLQLPAHYRTALVLKYVEEMPVQEIAEVMKRSFKSVESILVRARRSLAEVLEGGSGKS
ncbi:MAG: RNA polymerase sigma factor [Anaerolineae bacterium]|nr:RNA polymerase sigma factor [Anaerolineae bacterium]